MREKGSKLNLTNLRKSVVVLHCRSREEILMATTIAVQEKAAGNQVSVLDLSRFAFPSQFPHRGSFWKNRSLSNPSNILEYFENLDIEFVTPTSRIGSKEARVALLPFRQDVAEASLSTVQSELGDDFITGLSLSARLFVLLAKSRAFAAYRVLASYLESVGEAHVFVFNGRLLTCRMEVLAAKASNAKVSFYEHLDFPGFFYLGPVSPHDRIGMQLAAKNEVQKLSTQEIVRASEDWLAERSRAGSSVNPFSGRWAQEAASYAHEGRLPNQEIRSLTMFTSSTDEFAALGHGWNEARWNSQFEAFDALLGALDEPIEKIRIRIHPNLLNKSLSNYQRDMKQIRGLKKRWPEIQVILAGESTNSYDLMRASDLVVVANSTVGVEACLLGKSVVCTNSTYYDLIADVVRYHGEGDDLKVLTGTTPKVSSAQIWVAGMKSLVVRIDDSARLAFESVDQSRSFFAIALGFVTSLQGYTVFIEVKKKLRRLIILLLLEKLSHRALH